MGDKLSNRTLVARLNEMNDLLILHKREFAVLADERHKEKCSFEQEILAKTHAFSHALREASNREEELKKKLEQSQARNISLQDILKILIKTLSEME